MYLFDKIKSLPDKQHNKGALRLVEQIRQKREYELNKPEIYTGYKTAFYICPPFNLQANDSNEQRERAAKGAF